ncbi:hypothetical protein [Rhizobium leguminosarum]|uniref:hypothetical protein n=1 Tax=Rhizobium leguminosarum TaxID=384 RepID=UPI00143F06C1|nr:hypothetical protein [Rhizobium leguminosarum]NKL23695.1 hypothetical protein [Rhizobium leguminosarum bv. viciae]
MSKPTVHWRTEWDNGAPTHVVTLSHTQSQQRDELERTVDNEGFIRDGDEWRPTVGATLHSLFEAIRAIGFVLEFERDDENAPFDLQRLKLKSETREKLETISNVRLDDLAGYCPVQAEGQFDGLYFYFRARGSHWRFEAGGNESGTKRATWWHEEYWPNTTGFEAGYMDDEDAIRSILKSVEKFRTEDRTRFRKGHPEYERTTLEGWSLDVLSLSRVVRRLGISGHEAIERAKAYGIELPYFADLELKALETDTGKVVALDKDKGIWTDLPDEDE